MSNTATASSAKSSVASLYALKGLLAFFVVGCHAPLSLPWLSLPGMAVELFFVITGYFLFAPDPAKVQSRIWGSVKKVVPLILALQLSITSLSRSR